MAFAVVFPIVFSINAAYRRREEALRYFASIKAHSAALYFAHRDWLPNEAPEHAERMAQLTTRFTASHAPLLYLAPRKATRRLQATYQVLQ